MDTKIPTATVYKVLRDKMYLADPNGKKYRVPVPKGMRVFVGMVLTNLVLA